MFPSVEHLDLEVLRDTFASSHCMFSLMHGRKRLSITLNPAQVGLHELVEVHTGKIPAANMCMALSNEPSTGHTLEGPEWQSLV